jgi:hypothetical protein
MRARLSEQKRQAIITALTINPNATAVAREIGGVSVPSVWKTAKRAGIELTAGLAARGCNTRMPQEKRVRIIEALTVTPNASAVAKQVGGVSAVGVWLIAQAEHIDLTHSRIDQARRRRNATPSHVRIL